MIARIFKGFWFISMLVTVGLFLYVYAGLPQEQEVMLQVDSPGTSISRETLFYGTLLLLVAVNALVFISRVLPVFARNGFAVWLFGLVSAINLFITVALQLISVMNGQEKYDYSRMGVVIYAATVLLIGWALWWPIYRLGQTFFTKGKA